MLGPKTLAPLLPTDEIDEIDYLILLDGDSIARKIFLAYTTRIPWAKRDGKPLSRQDQACYLPGVKKKI